MNTHMWLLHLAGYIVVAKVRAIAETSHILTDKIVDEIYSEVLAVELKPV